MLFKVERKQSKDIRQRSAVATPSFTPVGELQATDRANLLYGHIDKGAGADLGVVRVVRSNPLSKLNLKSYSKRVVKKKSEPTQLMNISFENDISVCLGTQK